VALAGNLVCVACLLTLWAVPMPGFWVSALLLSAVGLMGLSFPLLMAHGRSFFPQNVLGRGVTLLNLFSVGGAGVLQMISARVHAAAPASPAESQYAAIFLFFGLTLLAGLAIYAFSRDRLD
jgi:hypothetical protein